MADRQHTRLGPKTLWPEESDDRTPKLDTHFTSAIVARARKRVVFGDLLFMILRGFSDIILGFLHYNPNSPRATNKKRE